MNNWIGFWIGISIMVSVEEYCWTWYKIEKMKNEK